MIPTEQVFIQVAIQSARWTVQITAVTPSVKAVDINEITNWFTGREKDLLLRCDPYNLFFHPLPSGYYALGVFYPAQRSFLTLLQQTQSYNVRIIIVSPQTLIEYANHPIALWESLRQTHQVPFVSQPPKYLSPILPAAPSAVLNKMLLISLADCPGAMPLAQLVQSLFHAECTLFTSRSVSTLSVLSAMFDLLPIRYRTELTFSSDFFFSEKNSFRLSGFSRLPNKTIRLMKQWGVPVISLERENRGSEETLDPWAYFVYQLLLSRQFDFLEHYWDAEYRMRMLIPDTLPMNWDSLHETGITMSQAMNAGVLPESQILATDIPIYSLEELRCIAAVDQMIPLLSVAPLQDTKPARRQHLFDRFPQYQHELDEWESFLVRGIFGDESSFSKIKKTWIALSRKLDENSIRIIREDVIALIHSILLSQQGNSGERLLRSSQLLELMMFFLQQVR